jgi:hypothetical protein
MSWDAQPPSEPPQPVPPTGYDQYGQPIAPQPTVQWHSPQADVNQWNATQQWDATQTNAAPSNTAPSNTASLNGAPPNSTPWGQPPYGAAPPFFGAAPPKRSRTGLYVGVGAGAVVVAGVVAAVVAMSGGGGKPAPVAQSGNASATASSGASTPNNTTDASPTHGGTSGSQTSHTLSIPPAAGPLHLVVNGDTEQRISDLKKNLASNTAYPNPQAGFYRVGASGSFSVWMLAQDTTQITDFQNTLGLLGPAGVMKQITDGASMKDVTVENPGPLGGALDCGKLTVDDQVIRSCVWVDHATFGWVYFLPSVSESKLLQYTQNLRAAAEH